MRTYLDCIPCFFKQAIESARIAGADEKTQKRIIDRIAKALPKIPLTSSPPEVGRLIYGTVRKLTRVKDPYKKNKIKSNNQALGLYKKLKKKVKNSQNHLLMAVRLAIAGNIIDYGVSANINVSKELNKILKKEHKAIKSESKHLFNYKSFRKYLEKAKTVLYIGDNAGEIVFDRILIEEIKKLDNTKKIFYAVKDKPIINDALKEDAHQCKIDKIAEVISSGLDVPGTVLSLCSKSFLEVYKKADMIISKGQGNFEALSDHKKKILFLFMAKCPVVAKHLNCRIGDIILLSEKK